VDKNPPANVGDTGPIPGPGKFHMLLGNQARMPQLMSLCAELLEPMCLEPVPDKRSHCNKKPVYHNEEYVYMSVGTCMSVGMCICVWVCVYECGYVYMCVVCVYVCGYVYECGYV